LRSDFRSAVRAAGVNQDDLERKTGFLPKDGREASAYIRSLVFRGDNYADIGRHILD